MKKPKCPFCGKVQIKSIQSWRYVNGVDVNRFHCHCGKLFNFYFTLKGKSWTIPKSKI